MPRTAFLFSLLALGRVVQAGTLTSLVNLFIGTASGANGGSGGNAFPGAAVPHAMAKVGIDVSTAPRQAGYVHDNSTITGISLMHDEGTGGNTNGGYGIFPLFPLQGCNFVSCPVGLSQREALRAANTDAASPGYFTTTFVNGIQIETTSTRRAGLIRFTFPNATNATTNQIVVDLTNDLGRSFSGGSLTLIHATTQTRVQLSGTFLQSYGQSNYTAYACYDFVPPPTANSQQVVQLGTYQSSANDPSTIVTSPNTTSLAFPYTYSVSPIQAGALLSFQATPQNQVLARFGVSMISSAQACSNAESEIASWDFAGVQSASDNLWENVLERIQIDVGKEDPTVVELLYSSLYRSALVPANMTGENPYWQSEYPFYDAFFCSWDVFRTVHPLLSLTSPREWAEIVNAYIDGWRATGYIPECRANTKAGYVQGGSDGMPILGDFAVKYGSNAAWAAELGVPTKDLYQALVDTAENTPPNWYTIGRQNTAWKQFGYIPTDWIDPSGSVGLPTREASRSLEYALGDFAVRQAALHLSLSVTNPTPGGDVELYGNRSMGFPALYNPNVTSDGFSNFAQRMYTNGTFAYSPPDACSPVDPVSHSCARGTDNDVGFYESSSWEMSFFAPHSMSTIVKLMGGVDTFIQRVQTYFSKGYFTAGNEPSFAMPYAFHYAGRPDLSVLQVRNTIYTYFSTGIGGIPGNDDSGAMAALLVFHLLGLYPVPSSHQLLIGSPLLSSYTLTNNLLDTSTTVTVSNFDSTSLSSSPPSGSRVYVQSVTINGVSSSSVCWMDFKDIVGGGNIVIEVTGDAGAAASAGCGPSQGDLPDSLETGGFS